MNRDLDALSQIQKLSSDEFEKFKSAIRILTSKTFIIRGIDKERELYQFVIRNQSMFDAWLSCMDASLASDESSGVIAFRGSGNTRLYSTREEICGALVLRLLYEDKKLEVTLTAFPVISVSDFQQKYNALTGDEIKKTSLINVLHKLSSYKLISLEGQDYADPDGQIKLYPSIPLSISRDALDEALDLLAGKDSAGGEEEEAEDNP